MKFDYLPLYQSHKVVRAARILSIDFEFAPSQGISTGPATLTLEGFPDPVRVDYEFTSRQPGLRAGGYFVVYEDGYTSFSPAKAFEDGYRLAEPLRSTQLGGFNAAMGHLLSGGFVARESWKINTWIDLPKPAIHPVWHDISGESNYSWTATVADLAASDWIAVYPAKPADQPESAFVGVCSDFGIALRQLKAGNRVARAGWNGKGMWLSLSAPQAIDCPAERFWSPHNRDWAKSQGGSAKVLPSITMKTATGEILMGWLASQTDMLADDWVVV